MQLRCWLTSVEKNSHLTQIESLSTFTQFLSCRSTKIKQVWMHLYGNIIRHFSYTIMHYGNVTAHISNVITCDSNIIAWYSNVIAYLVTLSHIVMLSCVVNSNLCIMVMLSHVLVTLSHIMVTLSHIIIMLSHGYPFSILNLYFHRNNEENSHKLALLSNQQKFCEWRFISIPHF